MKKQTPIKTLKLDDEFFDDDPLRSNAPLVPYTSDLDNYENTYLAFSHTEGQKMVEARKEAWTHHCQWLRRATLAQHYPVRLFFLDLCIGVLIIMQYMYMYVYICVCL